MATEDAVSFDDETSSDNLACNPNQEPSVRKMSIHILVNDDDDFAVNKEVHLSIKNARNTYDHLFKIMH